MYKTSFTTGGLFYRETIKVAEIFMQSEDWGLALKQIQEANALQTRTSSSLKRTLTEVVQRLQTLTSDQLSILIDGDRKDQNDILWLAVCKQYEIIREFAVKVIREKFLRYDRQLSSLDWNSFFNSKAEWDDHLDRLTDSTKEKLRQVLFLILREAEIISESNMILPAVLSPRVFDLIKNENPENLMIFPISNLDVEQG